MFTKTLVVVCLMVAVLLTAAAWSGPAQAQGALMAGAAKAKITPTTPQWMAGYDNNRRSTGVHDDLWARALVLKSGDQVLAIASVDLLGFPNVYVQRVRGMVKAVPADRVIIAATHVHSAPDVIGLWGPKEGESGVDKAYVDMVVNTVAQVIEQAAGSLAPASIKYAGGDLPNVSKNVNVEAILDPGLAALQAVGADGKPIATLVNFACHPEIMQNTQITADFPNWTYQRIEGAGGGVALFINGAQGGMITANIENIYQKGKDNWQDPEMIGNAIGDRALELIGKAEPVKEAPIVVRNSDMRVPLKNARFEAGIKAGVLPEMRQNGDVKTEVEAGTIGRAEFVTIPGEAFPNIGFLLKRWMTGDVKFIFGITEDELGYIMSREDWGLKLYDYETSMSVGPDMGFILVETLKPMIEAVNPKAAEAAVAATPAGATPAAGGSLDEWFMGLPKRFNADAAGDMKAVYYFNVTGAGGGNYGITVADKQAKVERAKPEKPDLTVTVAAPDMAAIVAGTLDAQAAFMTGKLQLDGDISLAMKLGDLFFGK